MPYSYTPAQAREYIYRTFMATFRDPVKGWQNLVGPLGEALPLSQEPALEFDNDKEDESPDVTEPTIYLYIRHYTSNVSHVGGETRRSVTRKGFVLAKVKVPIGTDLKIADALSYILKTAMENKRALGDGAGIIFRAWRPTETGVVAATRFQIVSQVDFEYDEHTED